jgi:FixJ family two-component response regulator
LSNFAEADEFERTFNLAEALLDSDAAVTATPMLLDIHLGGIAGIELRRCLAAVGSGSPVIFRTAIDDEATRKAAMKAGCVAYLKKPFARQGKRWPSESVDPADGRFAPEAVVPKLLTP